MSIEGCTGCDKVRDDYGTTCMGEYLVGLKRDFIKTIDPKEALILLGIIDSKKAFLDENILFSESSVQFPTDTDRGKLTLKTSGHRRALSITYTIILIREYCTILEPTAPERLRLLHSDLTSILDAWYRLHPGQDISHSEFHGYFAYLCSNALNITRSKFIEMYDEWQCEII